MIAKHCYISFWSSAVRKDFFCTLNLDFVLIDSCRADENESYGKYGTAKHIFQVTFLCTGGINHNKAELFEGSFFCGGWGVGQFDPPSYFKQNLSNINMTLYNC